MRWNLTRLKNFACRNHSAQHKNSARARGKNSARRGDTLVEVIFSISVFSLVAVLAISAMNNSIATAQGSLEITMARNEIDAQAEALRFIHNSFLSEREYTDSEQVYRNLWKRLTDSNTTGGLSNNASNVPDLTFSSCDVPYDSGQSGSISSVHGFIVNTRSINPSDVSSTILPYSTDRFTTTPLYPRVIYSTNGNLNGDQNSEEGALSEGQLYTKIAKVEGIWVVSIAGVTNSNSVYTGVPEYYDFHIRTCWYSPGSSTPSTIGTIIRLYNPELVEVSR